MAKKKQTLQTPDSGSNWRSWLAEHRPLLFLVVIALILRIWNLNWGLPQLYEEAIPLRFGMKLWDLTKNPIDYHFFVYPSFTYFLNFFFQAIHFVAGYLSGTYAGIDGFLKAYQTNPTSFAIIARLVSVLFDVGSVVVAYLFLLDFSDKRTALVGAFLLAVNPLHVAEAHLINVDTPFTFFGLLALLFFYKVYRQPDTRTYLLAGIAIGLATATKYHGLVLVLAFTCVQLFKSKTLAEAFKSLTERWFIYALTLSGVVFLILNPFILPHFQDFMLKLKSNELHMEAGHLGIDANTSTLGFYFLQSLPQHMGIVLVLFSTGSMLYLLASRERRNWVLLGIPVLLLILLGSWKMRADRYILPIVPFMIICASIVSVRIWDYSLASGMLKKMGWMSSKVRASIGIVFVLVLSIPMMMGLAEYHRSLTLTDTRTVTKQWIENHLRPGSAIATGPFGVELADTAFLIMPIQFSAVSSEQMVPLYDTRWYEDMDLLIASDFDYGRYRQDPVQYRDFLRFYDTLRTTWKLLKEFAPDSSQTGPTIWLYKFDVSHTAETFDTSLITNLTSSALDDHRIVDFLGKLGLILKVKGKSLKSAQAFLGVLSLDPGNTIARSALANLSQRLNAQSNSVDAKSTNETSRNVDRLLKTAGTLLDANDLNGAEREYRKVIALDKQNDSAYVQLVLIYALRDDRAGIIDVLTKYLGAIPPGDPRHEVVAEQLRKVKLMSD